MSQLPEILQERAALYAAGALAEPERLNFELLLKFHEELQANVARLQEAATATLLGGLPVASPPAALRERILAAIGTSVAHKVASAPVARVRTGPDGLIEWVNPAFTAMCGYELGELRGRKPGALLQGKLTDPAAVARLREGIRTCRPAEAELINYHKDGSRYRVHVAITPILDDEQRPLFFVAEEQQLALAG